MAKKSRGLLPILLVLLAFCLLTGCHSAADNGAVTAAPKPIDETQTPVSAASPTSAPTAAPGPTGLPETTPEAAEETAEPTPAPRRIDALPDLLADSCWYRYAYETEGSYEDAIDGESESWLEFYPEGPLVNYYERSFGSPWMELRALEVLEKEGGELCFCGEADGVPMTFTLTAISEWELELSCEWTGPDGVPGGSTWLFNRANEYNDGRQMDEEELRSFVSQLGEQDWAFFYDIYACPQEIHWPEIASGGLGIRAEADAEQIAGWRKDFDEPAAEPVVLLEEEVGALCREKTGTDYSEAQEPILWWYWDDGMMISAWDPRCTEPVAVFDGYRMGDLCRLYFTRGEETRTPLSWSAEEARKPEAETAVYVATLRLAPAGWQFQSCCPAGEIRPIQLASLSFFDTREEATEATGVTTFISTEHWDSDEPNWVWAVVQASTDGVRYRLKRAAMSGENAEAMEALMGESIPNLELCSGLLDNGECIALEVNMAWYPRLQLQLSREWYWTDYWFCQDLWNPALPREATRYLYGHDVDGEGRGCWPMTEAQLIRVLTDGPWLWQGSFPDDILSCLVFYENGELDIVLPETWYSLRCQTAHLAAETYEAPDLLQFSRIQGDWSGWDSLPGAEELYWLGDYRITLQQLPGEQILGLHQTDEGVGALNLALPDAAEDQRDFYFHRYQGTTPYEPVG